MSTRTPGWKARVVAMVAGALVLAGSAAAQSAQKTRNVVVIMSDGVRWQDVFRGADPALIDARSGGVSDTADLRIRFGRTSRDEARKVLFPFLWSTVATQGILYGDQDAGSVAAVTNGLKFSYPGYNETFSGHADPRIDSNDAVPNPNVTVFEWLNRQPGFEGKVAAFGTWDRFAEIVNEERSGIPVYAGWEEPFPTAATPRQTQLNELYRTTTRLWHDVVYDSFLQQAVLEYVRARHPRVLFVGYGETDEWAHGRRYDHYLDSAHQADAFIAQLWSALQEMPEYRGTTTFLITTDHGRGGGPQDWTDHGKDVAGAENIWIGLLGPDTPARGVVRSGRVTQSQVAATVAALLGLDFRGAARAAAPPLTAQP